MRQKTGTVGIGHRGPAATVLLVVPLALGLSLLAPPLPARADIAQPQSKSAPVRYLLTVAARVCDSYDQIMAARVRGDRQESARRPARDSVYRPGQPVAADVEAGGQPDCRPLTGVRFTFGSGHRRSGALSTVSGGVGSTPPTKASTPLLDIQGQPTGAPLAGATTVALNSAQLPLINSRGRLWVQGGTPTAPLPTADGSTLGFGTLRCGFDQRDGANVAWLGYPAQIRHAFCFAYYVTPGPAVATVTVTAALTRPTGYPQALSFVSNLTYAASGTFTLPANDSAPATVRFARAATGVGEAAYTVTAQPPPGWAVAGLTCTATRPDGTPGTSTATVVGPTANLVLTGGETMACGYTIAPPAVPRLNLRAVTENGVGTLGFTVTGAAGTAALSATTAGEREPVPATGVDLNALPDGAYTVTETLPAADAAAWRLASVVCDGVAAPISGLTATVTLEPGATHDCVFRNVRTPGSLRMRLVTLDGSAIGIFSIAGDGAGVGRTGGYGLGASTVESGTPGTAVGDLPGALPLGDYEITALPALSTVVGSWRLASLSCGGGPGSAAVAAGGPPVVTVTLSGDQPSRECVATYAFQANARLAVQWRGDGSATTVDITCADGAVGRVVSGTEPGDASLPQPLYFGAPTTCTVALGAGVSAAGVTATIESTPRPDGDGGGSSVVVQNLPTTIEVQAGFASYAVTVARAATVPPNGVTEVSSFPVPPMAFVGVGILLAGAFLLGLVLVRRRAVQE